MIPIRRNAAHTVVTLLVALLAAASAAPAQDAAVKANEYMQASAKFDHFMGSVLIAQHGKILLSKGYGMANLKLGIPNTPETEFRIGSNTKQFTAMAILLLQERQKLSVDDPVCKYVPDCPGAWAPITIQNLLTHTSGIPNFTSFRDYLRIRSQVMTPAKVMALFENKPLDFKPGSKFKYSNSGYIVLGYIIEKVSGQTYAQFLQQNIFAPLGLAHTGYGIDHPAGKDPAQGYFNPGSGFVESPYIDMSVPFSAGALYSTTLDLYRWDQSLTTNKLVSENSLEAMFHPYVAAPDKLAPPGTHYGFGWFISTVFGRTEIWHEGGISGFTSFNGWFPADGACVIVLDNTQSPEIYQISRALTAMLFRQPYKIPRQYQTITLTPDVLDHYVGQYQLAPGFILTIRREGPQLIAQAARQPPAPIYPESKTEFFYKVVDAQITFTLGQNGVGTGLVLHQNGRDMPAKKISSKRAAPPAQPGEEKSISLPESALEKLVGKYQLAPDFFITITRNGEQLSEQATNQAAFPIYPESPNEFFLKVVDAQITFEMDSEGRVTGLVLHQGGRDMPAKKVE